MPRRRVLQDPGAPPARGSPFHGHLRRREHAQGEYDVRLDFCDSAYNVLATQAGIRLTIGKRGQVEFGIQTYGLPLPRAGTYFMRPYFNGELAVPDLRFEVERLPVTP